MNACNGPEDDRALFAEEMQSKGPAALVSFLVVPKCTGMSGRAVKMLQRGFVTVRQHKAN